MFITTPRHELSKEPIATGDKFANVVTPREGRVRVTPRYGYSETCGRGTPAKVTKQMGISLAGPNTIATDLVGTTPKIEAALLGPSC